MVRQTGKRGELTIFRKPETPDPFVNSRLTSVGSDASGVERFWISCLSGLHGATSFLVDENGRHRAYRWAPEDGFRAIYSVARADNDTVWLAGGSTPFFIRLTLSSGEWVTYPREAGRFVTSGMVLDRESGKLFCGAQTAMLSFDTRTGTTVRVYGEGEKPPENFQYDSWRNTAGSYGFIMATPGLSYLRWDPKTESVNWKRLSDDPQHPAIPLIGQLKYVDGGRVYLPHIGWLDGLTGEITPHEHPPREEACWFGCQNGSVYGVQRDPLSNSGRFICWNPGNGHMRTLFTVPDMYVTNCALSQNGKVVMVDAYGLFRRYDARSGVLEVSRLIESEHGHTCNAIVPMDENRIAGAPFISQSFWIFNTARARGVYAGRVAGRAGQVDYALKVNGKVYFAAYTGGQLTELDPDRSVGFPRNPRLVAQTEQGNHGCGISTDGTVIWVAFRPKYGTLDGAMIRYDTEAGEANYKIGSLAKQHILKPMYDPAGDQLIGGSSFLSDCGSAPPVHDRAFAVVLDPATMEVCRKVTAPAGVVALSTCGPLRDGRWLMQSGNDLFAFVPAVPSLERYDRQPHLPEGAGKLEYAGEPGDFVIQIRDEFHLWCPEEGISRPIASQEPGFVKNWWVHGPDMCFDCARFAAVWRGWG